MTLTFGSLFAGIGGFDLGLERAGMQCVWQVENDKNCNRVLNRHWPDTPWFGNVEEFARDGATQPVRPDLICGGFPCQDLSVAGRRAGLAGERSGLWFEFARVIAALAPRWVLVENVPGLLSSNGGRDFGTVLGTLGQLGYGFAYRVLDAQWFGVPQRRRRVFVVGHLGDWRRAAEVLFEPESLPWDSPPSREAGKGVTPLLEVGARTGGRPEEMQRDGIGVGKEGDPMFSLQAKHQHGVVLPFDTTQVTSPGNYSEPKSGQPCHPLAKGQHPPAVAYGIRSANSNDKQRHAAEAEKARSLDTTGGFAPAQGGTVIAYPIDTRNALRTTEKSEMNRQGVGVGNDGEPAPTLTDVFQPGIAYGLTGDPTPKYGKETMPSLRAEQGGEGRCVANRMAIRHLTPRECERLQGFPDDWTRWDADGNEMKDGPRYRMLGNAVAMPVTEWIGRRIVKVRDDLAKP